MMSQPYIPDPTVRLSEVGGDDPRCRDFGEALVDLIEEWMSAKQKHHRMSIDGPDMTDLRRLAALVEEVGEAAQHLTYDKSQHNLREELIQVANVAMTWASIL